MSTLDNLRKQAKEWLRELRGHDPWPRDRYRHAYPNGPAQPGLRDVQHALAREKGFDSWRALKAAVAAREAQRAAGATVTPAVVEPDTHEGRVATFLDFACWDHHTHGANQHAANANAAMRWLTRHPEIARDSLYTAVVCGEVEEVRRLLAADPSLANRKGGSRGWEPLLYLCYARLPLPRLHENALAVASLLLDHGANPNAYYMAGMAVYSALVGVAGEGEQDAPRHHSYMEPLYALLLERGAGPYDIQVLYNTHFSMDVLWWLELTYQHDLRRGDISAWQDPAWNMLGMGGYGQGAYFLISRAVRANNLAVATWVLEHGADPNDMASTHPKFKPGRTHYEVAVMNGFTEMAELLLRHGGRRVEPVLTEEESFIADCFRLDREAAERKLAQHPEWRQAPFALFAAARKDRADVVAFLLDLGVPLEVEGKNKERVLHEAAGAGAMRVARLLVERGAEIDPRETNWGGTPIGWASYGNQRDMIEFLAPLTRNIWTLIWLGKVDRVRDVLADEPQRARDVSKNGATPLMWLPDDEQKAAELVDLLVGHGADPSQTSDEGLTAADYARKRGLDAAAQKLAEAANPTDRPTDPPIHRPTDPSIDRSTDQPIDRPDTSVPGMIPPIEVTAGLRMRLNDGSEVPAVSMWNMLTAARNGDLTRIRELVDEHAALAVCAYNYMPPLHLAVREGHLEIVRFLADRGAVNPKYLTYPYREPLTTVARDRGYEDIAAVIEEHLQVIDPDRPEEEGGEFLYERDEESVRFQKLVNLNGSRTEVEALLRKRPELALDPFMSWGEGILAMPANRRNLPMLQLLLEHGARVPPVTKWGVAYYFKHTDVTALLLERGASARHMNCHHTTVLHDMAHTGDVDKAALLLDHGADIDAVDEEFRSTPLGLAARFGKDRMVDFLLKRGADPARAGAEWATPLEWARKKGQAAIATLLARVSP